VATCSGWQAGDWLWRLPECWLRVALWAARFVLSPTSGCPGSIPPSPVSQVVFVGKSAVPFSTAERDRAVRGSGVGVPLFSPPRILPARACTRQSFTHTWPVAEWSFALTLEVKSLCNGTSSCKCSKGWEIFNQKTMQGY